MIQKKSFPPPPLREEEILRYALCREESPEIRELLQSCLAEGLDCLSYMVCWQEFPLHIRVDTCDFGAFSLCSHKLSENLRGCERVLVFAATLGLDLDRLIAKYGRLSPSRALMLQAMGAERIEALCDRFCEEMEKEYDCPLRPRFSPGYGDLPLESQKVIFSLLDCSRQIGLFLNESLIMSPSKSVTAFVGLENKKP